jgi:hypothetical protein
LGSKLIPPGQWVLHGLKFLVLQPNLSVKLQRGVQTPPFASFTGWMFCLYQNITLGRQLLKLLPQGGPVGLSRLDLFLYIVYIIKMKKPNKNYKIKNQNDILFLWF